MHYIHGLQDSILYKYSLSQNSVNDLNPSKTFCEMKKTASKIHIIDKTSFKEKRKWRNQTLPDSKTFVKLQYWKLKRFDSSIGKQIIATKQRAQEQSHLHVHRYDLWQNYHRREIMIYLKKVFLVLLDIQVKKNET